MVASRRSAHGLRETGAHGTPRAAQGSHPLVRPLFRFASMSAARSSARAASGALVRLATDEHDHFSLHVHSETARPGDIVFRQSRAHVPQRCQATNPQSGISKRAHPKGKPRHVSAGPSRTWELHTSRELRRFVKIGGCRKRHHLPKVAQTIPLICTNAIVQELGGVRRQPFQIT